MRAIFLAPREPRLAPFTCTRPPGAIPVLNVPLFLANLFALGESADGLSVIGESADDLSSISDSSPETMAMDTVGVQDSAAALLDALRNCSNGVILMQAHDRFDKAELAVLTQNGGILSHPDADTGGLAAAPSGGRILAICSLESPPLDGLDSGASTNDIVEHLCTRQGQDKVLKAIRSSPMVYPWHIIEANVDALQNLSGQRIEGTLQDGVSIEGPVVIGSGTTIKSGTTIEGPVMIGDNCTIGPCAYIRPNAVIGDDCFIGHSFEIFDSVVFDGTKGKHRSYVGHSVIGSNANLGCGLITSDYRHDSRSHVTLVDGKKLDSGRTKLGAFIGDGVKTGVQTLLYPGRKIWPGLSTLPGEIVVSDKTG